LNGDKWQSVERRFTEVMEDLFTVRPGEGYSQVAARILDLDPARVPRERMADVFILSDLLAAANDDSIDWQKGRSLIMLLSYDRLPVPKDTETMPEAAALLHDRLSAALSACLQSEGLTPDDYMRYWAADTGGQ